MLDSFIDKYHHVSQKMYDRIDSLLHLIDDIEKRLYELGTLFDGQLPADYASILTYLTELKPELLNQKSENEKTEHLLHEITQSQSLQNSNPEQISHLISQINFHKDILYAHEEKIRSCEHEISSQDINGSITDELYPQLYPYYESVQELLDVYRSLLNELSRIKESNTFCASPSTASSGRSHSNRLRTEAARMPKKSKNPLSSLLHKFSKKDTDNRETSPSLPSYPPEQAVNAAPSVCNSYNDSYEYNLQPAYASKENLAAPPAVDEVRFSAVVPQTVKPGKYLSLNIIMYEDEFRHIVDKAMQKEKMQEADSGYQSVERNSRIRIVLTSPDIDIDDDEEARIWKGKYLDFSFILSIPKDYDKEQILFRASIYINEIIATKLKFVVNCFSEPEQKPVISRSDITSAFVSYASQDRFRVASVIQGMQIARPDMDIFFDINSLRSGQKWEEALRTEIENRDVLFLCWSEHASHSSWVEMEWRYAFDHKGEDSIEPIPFDPPEMCPPPKELEQKHFNDKMLYIIKGLLSSQHLPPHLLRLKTNQILYIGSDHCTLGRKDVPGGILISGNNHIGREHAIIIKEKNQYYITDLDSTNHTYVDGAMIAGHTIVQIHDKSIIRLADEEFEFRLS